MTLNEKMNFCQTQYLYRDFANDYSVEISSLINDIEFINIINSISTKYEKTEFCYDMMSQELKDFKRAMCDELYNSNAHNRFSEYNKIYSKIRAQGNTGASATISLYYAIRYKQLSDEVSDVSLKQQTILNQCNVKDDYDVRKNYPTPWRCDDGHNVRSKNEQLVDNWLYNHNICHAYEKKIFDREGDIDYISDFYIPSLKLYIEIWGLDTPEYQKKAERKIAVYQKNGDKLLSLFEKDIRVLDDVLSKYIL